MNSVPNSVSELMVWANPILMGVIGFFLIDIKKKYDEDKKSREQREKESLERYTRLDTTLQIFQFQIQSIMKELAEAVQLSKESKALTDRISIVDRNVGTAFERIDQVRDYAEGLSKKTSARNHFLANKIQILRMKAELNGWKFEDGNWQMPSGS